MHSIFSSRTCLGKYLNSPTLPITFESKISRSVEPLRPYPPIYTIILSAIMDFKSRELSETSYLWLKGLIHEVGFLVLAFVCTQRKVPEFHTISCHHMSWEMWVRIFPRSGAHFQVIWVIHLKGPPQSLCQASDISYRSYVSNAFILKKSRIRCIPSDYR